MNKWNNKFRYQVASCSLFILSYTTMHGSMNINPLKPELNSICYLLALLGAHHFLHISRIRVKLLTFRLLMSYIYMEHPLLMFLDHTQRRTTVGRTALDELITRPEESSRLWCVVVCDLETSRMGAPYRYDISHLRVKYYTFIRFCEGKISEPGGEGDYQRKI